jgi:hypothetical protein
MSKRVFFRPGFRIVIESVFFEGGGGEVGAGPRQDNEDGTDAAPMEEASMDR